MGLDLCFSRERVLKTREAEFRRDRDAGSNGLLFRVPGMIYWIDDCGDEGVVRVRANKWGQTYGVLTAWLRNHRIPFDEEY
jgi:hypothetical protein